MGFINQRINNHWAARWHGPLGPLARCRPRCRRIFGIRHDRSNMYCKTKVLNMPELLELYSPMVLEYAYQHLPLSKITQSCTM